MHVQDFWRVAHFEERLGAILCIPAVQSKLNEAITHCRTFLKHDPNAVSCTLALQAQTLIARIEAVPLQKAS